jgi:hypothetical protein
LDGDNNGVKTRIKVLIKRIIYGHGVAFFLILSIIVDIVMEAQVAHELVQLNPALRDCLWISFMSMVVLTICAQVLSSAEHHASFPPHPEGTHNAKTIGTLRHETIPPSVVWFVWSPNKNGAIIFIVSLL